jgi:DNA-binding NtrC family response regulator
MPSNLPRESRDLVLSPGDVLRLGEKTFFHFGEYLAHGSFFLAERLVETFAAAEKEGGEFGEILSAFLYRLLGIVLNILQAREGLLEVNGALAGTQEALRISGFRDREVPHVRRGGRAILRTLSPEELRTLDWKAGQVEPVSRPWVRAVRRGDTVHYLFNEAIGVEFRRVEPADRAMAMRNRALCVPLRAAGNRVGALYCAREAATGLPFGSEDVSRAEDVGLLASAVLDRLLARRSGDPLDELLGNAHVHELVRQWESNPALADMPVLVTGERGTGKEIVARAVHHHSRRRAGPFVAVNLALHGGDRLAPELFGTAAGKFTGVGDSPGLFEVAGGGTLFLDEIGAMPPDAQAKVLRAVERREIMRVGGTDTLPVDVRIVAATNRDLDAEARAGRFMPDLLDRLAFLEIRLKPVREFAAEEKGDLFGGILRRMARRLGLPGLEGIADDAMSILMAYPWLGNVRELEKELGNAGVRWSAEGRETRGRDLAARHLSPQLALYQPEAPAGAGARGPAADLDVRRAMDAIMRNNFEQALELSDGQADAAAALLGLNLKTFYRRAKELGRQDRMGRRRKLQKG